MLEAGSVPAQLELIYPSWGEHLSCDRRFSQLEQLEDPPPEELGDPAGSALQHKVVKLNIASWSP